MVIGKGESSDGRQFVVLGLSKINVDRLQQGQSIRITPKTHPVELNADIFIVYGETEQEIANQLVDAGLIGSDTDIKL